MQRGFILGGVVAFLVFATLVLLTQGGRSLPPRVSIADPTVQPRSAMAIPDPPAGRSVFFAPLGDFPEADVEALVANYDAKYRLAIGRLPSIPLPPEAFDAERGQYIAEALIEAVVASHDVAADPDTVVIALTSADIYIASQDWTYAYGLRADGHLAVVSTARMDAFQADEALQMQRLRKLVTKNIGLLYYGLPVSDDPTSVLYRDILGPRDLDRVSEDF